MFDIPSTLLVCTAYIAILFLIASVVEKKAQQGLNLAANPWIYSLSLAVYCTTWTFFGSVGTAASHGMLFLPTYLGPTLSAILWWSILRKMVRLKDRHRLTSIADLISARYGKSRFIAALVTLVVVAGVTPYVGLQFKALTSVAAILTGKDATADYAQIRGQIGAVFACLMILFTVFFGLRRINPTERHPGMMVVLSVESLVKMVAFFAAGIYITLTVFGDFGQTVAQTQKYFADIPFVGRTGGAEILQWCTHLLLGGTAIFFLPRQFHVAVVENSNEKHIRTAMWLFPLYLLLINLFVLPIAAAGLSLGFSGAEGDTFVIKILADQSWLSMLIFVGGFSAATGMIMIETVAIATMVVNHLLLPVIDAVKGLGVLRRYLLQCRWVAAAVFILAGFFYERFFVEEQGLVSIGIISFAAVLQFGPALFGGLYWKQANKTGAILGILGGFLVWAFTLGLPALAATNWVRSELLSHGLFGLSFLRPQQLFWLEGLDPVTHSVFWSMVVNCGLFGLGSLLFRTSPTEAELADEFADPFSPLATRRFGMMPDRIESLPKQRQVEALFANYFNLETAALLRHTCFRNAKLDRKERFSILELAELQSEIERTLAAAIGTAAAHAAIRSHNIISAEEAGELSGQYAALLAEMRVSPAELRTRIDYYRERERILSRQAGTFRLLSEVSQRLAASIDYEPTLNTVSRIPLPSLAECVILYVIEEPRPGEKPSPRWIVTHVQPALEKEIAGRIQQSPPELSAFPHLAQALETGKVVTVSPDSLARWNRNLLQGLEIASSVTLPLLARNNLLGAITLISSRPTLLRYSDEIAILEELAHRCAIAIDNSRLFRNAQAAIRAREEFVSVASHELRTPLTPLRSQIQLLQRLLSRGKLDQYSPEKLEKLLESADRQTDRMIRLVNELLDISRASMGRLQLNRETCELTEIVRETTERFRDILGDAGCTPTLSNPGNSISGNWDRLRLEEIISNLLSNALKYAPGKPVEITISSDESHARVSVRDHGPGIHPRDQDRIFERFERVPTTKSVGGFGLGLYISRQIAEAHGGSLSLKSTPGEGAEFILELPLS